MIVVIVDRVRLSCCSDMRRDETVPTQNSSCGATMGNSCNATDMTPREKLNSPVKKSRFGQATSDATAMISAAISASNTATITTVIASAV